MARRDKAGGSMSDQQERWDPVERVVFKDKSRADLVSDPATYNNWTCLAVCVKSKVLRLSALETVSLDLVDTYFLLEERCSECKKGLGYPVREHWRSSTCKECDDKCAAKHKAEKAEKEAQAEKRKLRAKAILALLSEEDRAVIGSFLHDYSRRELLGKEES